MITFFPLRNISICDFYFAEGWSLTARTTFRWGVWLYCFCRKQQDRASQLQASSLRTWSVGSTQGKCTNSGFNKMWWQCVCVCVFVWSKSWSMRCRVKQQLIFLHFPTSVPLPEHFCLFDFTASDGACVIISKTHWWVFFCWNVSLQSAVEQWKNGNVFVVTWELIG